PPRPDRGVARKTKSPGGRVKRGTIRKPKDVPSPNAQVPADLYVPQTGRVLPNLPTVSGSGRGGAETFQDRASRCAHQSGVYGQAAGDPASYMGTCVNQ